MNRVRGLFWVKFVHTVIFLFLSFCLGYLFYSGITETYNWVLFMAVSALLLEGIVLLLNKKQCPLTLLARGYGDETGRITDMFLPAWFVPYVFRVGFTLFVIGVILLVMNYAIG